MRKDSIDRKVERKKRKTALISTPSEEIEEQSDIMGGRRIVELKITLDQQLWCVSYKEALFLEYIENETRRGLCSQLLVRCHKCLLVDEVATGKQYYSCD
jgi:hypothetical protein